MKRLISFTGLAFFLLALTTSGCKKEEVNPLFGTWDVNYLSTVTYRNAEKLNETVNLLTPGDMTIKIFSGGNGEEWEQGTLNNSFSWTSKGDSLFITVIDQESVMNMSYAVTDTKLLLTSEETSAGDGGDNVTTTNIIADRVFH
jgi:TRAP-type C4-dicarboxylate transport system substrate-binding protein